MMRIPGANVLNMAFRAVAQTSLFYYQANGRTLNAVGEWVVQYLNPVIITGSLQPIPKHKYVYLGLDLQRSYFYFYIPRAMIDLERDIAADQLGFEGQRYQVQSATKWYNVDGWMELLCVKIGIDTGAEQTFGFNTAGSSTGNQNFNNGDFLPNSNSPGSGPINE